MTKLEAQVLAQRLIETPFDTDVPDDLREKMWEIVKNPDHKKTLFDLVYTYLLRDIPKFDALKKAIDDYNTDTSDDEFYESYRTELTDALLDEYPWLEKNDFVQIEEHITFVIEDDAFLTRRFRQLTQLTDKIIKHLGKSEFDTFICMMLLALKYKILKIKDPHFPDPVYAVGYTKDALERYWKETCEHISEEDQKKIKTKIIEV